MLSFLIGMGVGAGAMYFGSEKVADNCARAAFYSEQAKRNKAVIAQKAMEQIAEWSVNGTLQQNLTKIYQQQQPQVGLNFNAQPIQPGVNMG